MENKMEKITKEKIIKPMSGWGMVFLLILIALCSIAMVVVGAIFMEVNPICIALLVGGVLCFILDAVLLSGFMIIAPNEATVLLLFGKYYGTVNNEGFYWVNIFCTAYNPVSNSVFIPSGSNGMQLSIGRKKISLKARTLDNSKQKVNDLDGNPIEIGVISIWRVRDTAKAVFNVDNYEVYISTQCDAAIRNIARQYSYDITNEDLHESEDEKTLRGSAQEIADMLKDDLQKRVEIAGLEIIETRIAHLAYSQEIAAAMLQRQQATAVVAAKTKIVEGAVGMVEMALTRLADKGIVNLNEEKKAQMVCNLMVVLCGSKDAQPVVNSGSID